MDEKMQKWAEALAGAHGLKLDFGKTRFVIGSETLAKLLTEISQGEFIRGFNGNICCDCQARKREKKVRYYSDPAKVWNFCKGCEKKRFLLGREEGGNQN